MSAAVKARVASQPSMVTMKVSAEQIEGKQEQQQERPSVGADTDCGTQIMEYVESAEAWWVS